MTDTELELKKLNENATLLLTNYSGVLTKLSEESQKILVAMALKSEEGLTAITSLLESGNVAQAENALKLEGKTLSEIIGNFDNRGLATAWIVGNTRDNIIYSSHNISGMTSISTGVWEFDFDIPMDNDNYAVVSAENAEGDSGSAGGATYRYDPKTGNKEKFVWVMRAYDNTDMNKRWFSLVVFGGKN